MRDEEEGATRRKEKRRVKFFLKMRKNTKLHEDASLTTMVLSISSRSADSPRLEEDEILMKLLHIAQPRQRFHSDVIMSYISRP